MDARVTHDLVSAASLDRDLMKRIVAVRSLVCGRIVFTTSFSVEDQAIAHAIFEQALEIEVVTLDTGRLFPQSYELWAQTERRYGRRMSAFCPNRARLESLVARQGIDGFFASVEARRACCGVRKVEPLRRALLSFIREHDIPYNSLHDRGFASIGCAPCTRAIAPGEPERAGRWWWEQEEKKECGLHRPRRAASAHERSENAAEEAIS